MSNILTSDLPRSFAGLEYRWLDVSNSAQLLPMEIQFNRVFTDKAVASGH
jgi:hypothetical protein